MKERNLWFHIYATENVALYEAAINENKPARRPAGLVFTLYFAEAASFLAS